MKYKLELEKLSLDELSELKNDIQRMINDYSDGFIYECIVSSYGSNHTRNIGNVNSLQELCDQYDGEDGIVTIYTNNEKLNIHNYGQTYYFKNIINAKKWREYNYLKINLNRWIEEWERWDGIDNHSFNERPYFKPNTSKEEIEDYKKEIMELENTIEEPLILKYEYR